MWWLIYAKLLGTRPESHPWDQPAYHKSTAGARTGIRVSRQGQEFSKFQTVILYEWFVDLICPHYFLVILTNIWRRSWNLIKNNKCIYSLSKVYLKKFRLNHMKLSFLLVKNDWYGQFHLVQSNKTYQCTVTYHNIQHIIEFAHSE